MSNSEDEMLGETKERRGVNDEDKESEHDDEEKEDDEDKEFVDENKERDEEMDDVEETKSEDEDIELKGYTSSDEDSGNDEQKEKQEGQQERDKIYYDEEILDDKALQKTLDEVVSSIKDLIKDEREDEIILSLGASPETRCPVTGPPPVAVHDWPYTRSERAWQGSSTAVIVATDYKNKTVVPSCSALTGLVSGERTRRRVAPGDGWGGCVDCQREGSQLTNLLPPSEMETERGGNYTMMVARRRGEGDSTVSGGRNKREGEGGEERRIAGEEEEKKKKGKEKSRASRLFRLDSNRFDPTQ
ncbi:hypothetical protein JCGZ_14990 [Jatropha curcas]|uniref:Uncharacterized protein n=1 Tax=Jatropha curcas TaxID=180498 RepID=A0A067KK38_JATCU|nr:hypothetical protein JCGZ_14990 [Jatropha curcas]